MQQNIPVVILEGYSFIIISSIRMLLWFAVASLERS